MVIDKSIQKYNFFDIEKKWYKIWKSKNIFSFNVNVSKNKIKYILDMFPYPSGDLHMGHAEAFAIADAIARYWIHHQYNVIHPIGWDSFGLPAENAAIKRNKHPELWTNENISTQKKSLKKYAISVDWDTELHTSDFQYYKWTQWLFIKLYNLNLVYRKYSKVNWCPKDKTVLANEQVQDGKCNRCLSQIEYRLLNQWYFKITKYANRLLKDMKYINNKWPKNILNMQRNWIGEVQGLNIIFKIYRKSCNQYNFLKNITVFTSTPELTHEANYLLVDLYSNLAINLIEKKYKKKLISYIHNCNNLNLLKSKDNLHINTLNIKNNAVFLGCYAKNPINNKKMPIWAGNYTVEYNTNIIMCTPNILGYNFNLSNIDNESTVKLNRKNINKTDGVVSCVYKEFNYLNQTCVRRNIFKLFTKSHLGIKAKKYKLKDWLISRQRFWGTPIPIIHCNNCGIILVSKKKLPIKLPHREDIEKYYKNYHNFSLSNFDKWKQVVCPQCNKYAKKETDTLDTFVDSSWYFLRYISSNCDKYPFDFNKVNAILPVDYYIGGVEHANLHLLYSRFITKVLYDIKLINFNEPFLNLINQGQVLNKGKAMSKSLGNGVDLKLQIDKFGVDAIRMAIIFASPPEENIDWINVNPKSMNKFLRKIWNLSQKVNFNIKLHKSTDGQILKNKCEEYTKIISDLMRKYKLNVMISKIMELTNFVKQFSHKKHFVSDSSFRKTIEVIVVYLSIFAPYTSEEIWHRWLGNKSILAYEPWPSKILKNNQNKQKVDDDRKYYLNIYVKGKMRDKLKLDKPYDTFSMSCIKKIAFSSKIIKYILKNKVHIKNIYINKPGSINFDL